MRRRGGPGAPRRWPRTEMFDSSPRRASTSACCPHLTARRKRRLRIARAGGAGTGAATGAGVRCAGPVWKRCPRRQTFVVKDSPVRALLPIVESRGPAPIPHVPAKPQGSSAATSVPRAPPSRNSAAAVKGLSGSRGLPPSRVGLPRPGPPPGQGAGARGRSEPPRGGTAGQPKARGGTVPCIPHTRQPHARTTTTPPVPSSCSPAPTALPKVSPRTPAVGGRTPIPRGAGAARAASLTAASGCKPGSLPARLRPPRKTAVSSTPR
ncbi:proline/serine-rich coiled-coil protein 1 isoform X2 [Catharus ustulatus]|uniref:proline/serine-rich coiled-coil protein 1 isoform X2 n=2 Tax=Catharus ustulatus TaxID=91951 RepID=UPI001C5BF2FC|nr:proline/serine-rich coiled-coil protein 1 isoform X2 [Catharus ustulatus]